MEHNHISSRTRTEVPSEMRKLGKDIKVRILPAEEAKRLKSGSVTSRKVIRNNMLKSKSWERHVPSPLEKKDPATEKSGKRIFSLSSKADNLSHQEEDLYSKADNLSLGMNREKLYSSTVSLSPQARTQRAVKASGAIKPQKGSKGSSREMNQALGSLMGSNSMCCPLLEKELPVSKGATIPGDSNYTRTIVQENNVNKIKYVIHISHLNGPALMAIWKGDFEIPNLPFNTNVTSYEGISAHPSAKVSRTAYELSKQLPAALHFTFHSLSYFLPETFQIHSPDGTDIALYFYPDKTDNSKEGNYVRLLKFLMRKDMMLKSCIGNVNLLIYPSTILKSDSHKLDGSYFMWGVFCSTKDNSFSGDTALRRHPL